ncbi:MAG: hypothetical protein QM796_00855 [Chthoniobacteraceae bacterium]
MARFLVDEDVEEQAELGFEPEDAEGRLVELDLLLVGAMRRVVAGEDGDGTVGNAFDERIHIRLGPQRGVHFEIGVEALDRGVGERDVVRADLAS